MPYKVVQIEDVAGADDEDLLNNHESDGWQLVNIIQGFATVEGQSTTVYWRPRYVFYRDTPAPKRWEL